MLKHRLITGPILIALLLGIVALDDWLERSQGWRPGVPLLLLALPVAALAGVEFARLARAGGLLANPPLTAVAAMLGVLLVYGTPGEYTISGSGSHSGDGIAILATGLIAILITSLIVFSRGRNVQGVLPASGAVLMAMAYIGLLLGFFLLLRFDHSAWWIVGIVLTTKSCDIGAYITGTAIGRHKLIPWLSPGKTWEGLFGGIAFAVLVGVGFAAMSRWLPEPRDHVPLVMGAIAGAMFAVIGQFGDLTMSLLKRGAGVKDSSRLLPGMGGVLDVIDSPILVAPVAYWVLSAGY